MNNPDSLRKQIIDSMKLYCDKYKFYTFNETMMFDEAIMPVLQAAMKAGELLVTRNTQPQIPVAEAIQGWLEGVLTVVARVKQNEKTISRAQVLKILFDLERVAQQALTDAKALPF